MKDNIITFLVISGILCLFFVYPFAIWGGNPEGLHWKLERYKKELDAKIEAIKVIPIPPEVSKQQFDEISQQIEVIRNMNENFEKVFTNQYKKKWYR